MILISLIGGSISIALSSLSAYKVFDLLSLRRPLEDLAKLYISLSIPGENLGIEKEAFQPLFLNVSLISLTLFYPLCVSINPVDYMKTWVLGWVYGIFTGIAGALALRLMPYSKIWNTLEVSGTILIMVGVYGSSYYIGASQVVSIVFCGVILNKYVFIADLSNIIKSNFLVCLVGVCEILAQVWAGVYLWSVGFQLSDLIVLGLYITYQMFSNSICIGILNICKIKSLDLKDCVFVSIGGFKGIPTLCISSILTAEIRNTVIPVCVLLNLTSILINKFLKSIKDDKIFVASDNPCTKLKSILQVLEESYVLPVFSRQSIETSILSPKFNENSQRFEPGIQLRQEPRDETSRELQALNLNITETELHGNLQLK